MPKGYRKDGKPGNRAGTGAGWGGPAKGASTAPKLAADDNLRGQHNADNIDARKARVSRHLDNLEGIAFHGEQEANRVRASIAVIDILDPPTKRIAIGGDAANGPVAIKVILEDLTTDFETEGQEAASTAGQDR